MTKPQLTIPNRQMRTAREATNSSPITPHMKKSGKSLEVHIFDFIDWLGFDVARFAPQLAAAEDIDEIVVKINSPGGSAFDGAAMYNLLVSHHANVRTEVHGLAGSAASVVAMAGDEILMGTASRLFIHKPWAVAAGNDDVFFKVAEDLKSMTQDFVMLYKQQARKLTEGAILDMLAKETEMSAKEAVSKGFATGLLNKDDEIKASASVHSVENVEDLRKLHQDRAAQMMRPHDSSKPNLSRLRRQQDILDLKSDAL